MFVPAELPILILYSPVVKLEPLDEPIPILPLAFVSADNDPAPIAVFEKPVVAFLNA